MVWRSEPNTVKPKVRQDPQKKGEITKSGTSWLMEAGKMEGQTLDEQTMKPGAAGQPEKGDCATTG